MQDLIAQLEAATGPNFELDCAIFKTRLPTEWFGSKVESWFRNGHWFGCNTADGYRHLECLKAHNYTASIDAAMTLIPEGYAISYFQIWPGHPATLTLLATRHEPFGKNQEIAWVHHREYGRWDAEANSAPLAICIAALKALDVARGAAVVAAVEA